MRRTAATRMLRLGVKSYTVMRLCGWASEQSLRIYDARCEELADEVTAAERARAQATPGELRVTAFDLRPAGAGRRR
jgi:integrase